MRLHEYYGRTELSILQFTIKVTDDIKEKMTQKKLLHNDDIVQYIRRQMDHFFQKFYLKPALLQTYKNEVLNSVMFKLKVWTSHDYSRENAVVSHQIIRLCTVACE